MEFRVQCEILGSEKDIGVGKKKLRSLEGLLYNRISSKFCSYIINFEARPRKCKYARENKLRIFIKARPAEVDEPALEALGTLNIKGIVTEFNSLIEYLITV